MVKRDACFRRIVAKMTFYELFSRQPMFGRSTNTYAFVTVPTLYPNR